MAPLATLKPGDTLPVAIHLDGTPVAGRIAVQPERGAVAFLSTGKDRPAEIRCRAAGAYLLTVARQGKTFALTFSVAPPAAGVAAP